MHVRQDRREQIVDRPTTRSIFDTSSLVKLLKSLVRTRGPYCGHRMRSLGPLVVLLRCVLGCVEAVGARRRLTHLGAPASCMLRSHERVVLPPAGRQRISLLTLLLLQWGPCRSHLVVGQHRLLLLLLHIRLLGKGRLLTFLNCHGLGAE